MTKKKITSSNPEDWSEEERDNLVGFFDLLLKIDHRIKMGKKKEKEEKEKKKKERG